MFVCVLVLLNSVNFNYNTIWKIYYFTQTPEEYCTRVVSSVFKSIFALWEPYTKVVSSACNFFAVFQVFKQLWFTGFSRCEINTHLQGEIDHNIFFMSLFVWKSRTILVQFLLLSKAEVKCWFSHSGWILPQKSLFNNIAFQEWWKHYLTVPFLSCRKNPSCVCQEFDTCIAG